VDVGCNHYIIYNAAHTYGIWTGHCRQAQGRKIHQTPEGGVYLVLYVFLLYFVLYLYFWRRPPVTVAAAASAMMAPRVLAVHLALGYAQCLTLSSIMRVVIVLYLSTHIYNVCPIASSFLVVYWASVLGHCSIYECHLQQNSGSDAVHTPESSHPQARREVAEARYFARPADLALIWPRVGRWCRDVQYHYSDFPLRSEVA
jgi:hypothetical protein